MYQELYKKYRWYILITIPMSIILGTASMSVVAIINNAINSHMRSVEMDFNMFVAVIVLLFTVGVLNRRLSVRMVSGVYYDIQITMIRRVIATSLTQLEEIGLPKVVATLNEDTATAVRFFNTLPILFVNSALVICGFIYMAYLSLYLILAIVGCILFCGISVGVLIWMTKKDRTEIRESSDKMIKHYQNIVSGAKEVNLNSSRRRFVVRSIDETTTDIRDRSIRVLNLLALAEEWGQLVLFAMLGFVVFLVGSYMEVTTQVILGYVMTLLFLIEPIETIIQCGDEIVEAKIAFDKIDSLKLEKITPNRAEEPHSQKRKGTISMLGSLRVRDVQYTYQRVNEGQQENFMLGPLTTSFKPGEATLIIGGNGSGKSTLLKVLCGLYKADKGEIYFSGDKDDLKCINKFRDNFSMITTDYWLFMEVLNKGGGLCEDDVIEKYLKYLKLDHTVSSKEGTLSTTDLSNGQRKRLALMQMYIEDKPIVLLDEWAADQDPKSKRLFYSHIIPYLKKLGKIIIFVSHDDQYYLKSADRVILIQEGKLIELNRKEIIKKADLRTSQNARNYPEKALEY